MASLIPMRPTLHEEVEEEFRQFQQSLVACDVCGDYHPPSMHGTDAIPFDPQDPEDA